MSFTVGPPPKGMTLEQFMSAVWDKFYSIENEFYFMRIERLHTAPVRPQDGQLAYADGVDWNPGSGRGAYMYDTTSVGWRFLG